MVSKAGSKPTYAQVASRSPSPVSSRASSPLSEVPDALPPQLEPPFTQAATKVDKGKGRKKATPAKRNAASKVNNEVGPPPKSSASTGFVTKFTPGGGTIEVEVDADVASAEDTDEDAGVGLDPDDSMYQDKAPRNRVKPVLQSIIKTRASNAKSQASSVPAATSPPTRSPGKRRRARTSTIASNSSGSSDNDVAKPSPKRSRCSTPVDDGPLPDMECDVVTDRYEADDAGSDMDVADVDMDVADVDASDCEVDEEYEAMDVQPEEGGGLSDSEGLSDGMASPTALVTTLRSDGEDDYDVQDPFIDDAAVEDVDCITDDASLVSDQDDGEVVGVELSGDKASAAGPNETALPDMAVYPPSDDEDVAPGPSPTPSPRVKRTSSLSKLATKPHEIPLSPAHLAPPPVGAAEPHPPSDDEEVVDPAPSPASSPRPKRTSSSSKPAPKSQPKPSSPALLAPPPARASQRNPPRDDDEGSEPAATPASAPRAKRTSSSSKPATKLQDKRASAAPLAPPPAPAADTQPPSDDEEGIVPAPDPTPTPKAKRTTSSSKPTTNPQVKHAPSTDIAPPPARASEVDPPSVKVEVVDPVPAPTPSTKTKRKSSSSKSATRTRPSTDDGQSTVQTSQPDPSGDPSGSRSKPDVDSKPRPARVSSRNAKPQHSGPPTAPPTTTVPPAAKLTAGSTQKSRSRTAKVTPVATSSAASEVVRPSPPPHLSDNVSGSEETPVAPPAPVAHERKRMTAPTPYADLSKPSPSKKQTTSDTKNVPSSSTSSKGKHKSPTGSVDKQTEAAEVLVSTASSVPVEAGPPVPETAPSEPTKKPVPPKKPRRTFQSVVSKSASGPSKRTGLVGDAYFHKTRTLPDVCQVTDPDLQDPELAQFYAGLPPLLKGYFKLWTDIQGDGYMCFSNWVEYCPDLDFDSCIHAMEFRSHKHFINIARISPLDVLVRELGGPSPTLHLYTGDRKIAICLSPVQVKASHILEPSPTGVKQKRINGVFHTQELERTVGFVCTVFGKETLGSQLGREEMQFTTRSVFGDSEPSSSKRFSPVKPSPATAPSTSSARAPTRDPISLGIDDEIPVYDCRDLALDLPRELDRLDSLPRWKKEVPTNSFAIVGHTITVFNSRSKKQWTVSFNLHWVMLLGIPSTDV